MALRFSDDFYKFAVGDKFQTLDSNGNLIYTVKSITPKDAGVKPQIPNEIIVFDRGDGKSTHSLARYKVIEYIRNKRMIPIPKSTAFEFIDSGIRSLARNFPTIKCSYRFDESSNTNLIEVLPNSVYSADPKYAKAEEDMISSFLALNINESICFITDTSLVKIGQPILVIHGNSYPK